MNDDPLSPPPGVAAYLDGDEEYQRWGHLAVRVLVGQMGRDETRVGMLVSLAGASTEYDDPADRRAFLDWHIRRLDGWLAEPLTEEN